MPVAAYKAQEQRRNREGIEISIKQLKCVNGAIRKAVQNC